MWAWLRPSFNQQRALRLGIVVLFACLLGYSVILPDKGAPCLACGVCMSWLRPSAGCLAMLCAGIHVEHRKAGRLSALAAG